MFSGGKLILSGARSLYEADLQDKHIVPIHGLDDQSLLYGQLSKIDDERFLFERGTPEQIYEYNRRTRIARPIRPGSRPTYIPEHDKFLFYQYDPVAKQTKLYEADLKNPVVSAREVEKGSFGYPLPVIQVSRDSVVFPQASDRYGYRVWHYNLVNAELKSLPLEDCLPYIWRGATRQLLCFDVPKRSYYLTSLDGKDAQYLPELGADIVEAYVHEHDTLLVGRVRLEIFPWPRGELHSIWAYHFEQRRMVRVLEETASGGKATAIWYR